MSNVATTPSTPALSDFPNDPTLQHEVERFLNYEAYLLDLGDLDTWLTVLADDIQYVVPIRTTRYGRLVEEFSTTSFVFNDDMFGLKMRVARLHTRFAWAEDPASRNRHFVTNIFVTGAKDDLVEVSSNVMLYRSRLTDPSGEIFTGERRDTLRRTDDGLKLVRREVYMDQTVLSLSAVTTFF